MRKVFGYLLIGVAVVVTGFFLFAVGDSLTGDYVGGEVSIVWTITGIAGVFAAAFWAAGLGLVRSANGRKRPPDRGV